MGPLKEFAKPSLSLGDTRMTQDSHLRKLKLPVVKG